MKDFKISPLFLVLLLLMGVGLVQVFSASFIFASENFNDGFYFLKKQLAFTVLGLSILVTLRFTPLEKITTWSLWLWPVSLALVALTLVPGFGVRAGGAFRWLGLPWGFRFEPSELLKVAFCFFLAALFVRRDLWLRRVPIWILFLILVIPFVLLHRQPDFGSIAILVTVGLGVLFAFGLSTRWIALFTSSTAILFYFLVMRVPYRRARIAAFFDPWADPEEKGFQSIQSMLTFHSGGLFGSGLGQGQGKLFFLPEAHTDFTLAVFGEEWGFLGFAVLISLYGYVVYKCLSFSVRSQNLWVRVFCLSSSIYFCLSVFINMGVVLNMLPTKGLTLPFLSYGGSSLVCLCVLFGVILNIENRLTTGT